MFGLFDRKKHISPQEAATGFIQSMVQACETERHEWRKTFIEGVHGSAWVSDISPEKINENILQWMLIASVMANQCLAIKNVFDSRVASHLYDAVYIEIKKLSNISGMEGFEDTVYGLMTEAEKDINNMTLMPHDSIAGNLISYFGFHPKDDELDVFPPIYLMMISSKILFIGGAFWKTISEEFKVKP